LRKATRLHGPDVDLSLSLLITISKMEMFGPCPHPDA
jgi:hypothetical protein